MEFPHDARYPPAVPVQRRLNLGLCMGNSQYVMALCLASWRAFRIRAPDWVQPDLQTPPPNAYPNFTALNPHAVSATDSSAAPANEQHTSDLKLCFATQTENYKEDARRNTP